MGPLVVTLLGALFFADGAIDVSVEDVRAALLENNGGRVTAKQDGASWTIRVDAETWRLDPARENSATRVRFASRTRSSAAKRFAELERLARARRAARERLRCPSAVLGARVVLADAIDGVRLEITAGDEAARREIRRRAADRAHEKSEGFIDPDERWAACPELVPRTRLVATDTAAGATLVVRPFDPSHLERLRAFTRDLAATNRIPAASKDERIMF